MTLSRRSDPISIAGDPLTQGNKEERIPNEFWTFVSDGEFRLPKCKGCNRWRWYPLPQCEACGTKDFEWALAPTRGRIFSFTRVHRNFLSGEPELAVPYSVALIDLDGAHGIRFVATLIEKDQSVSPNVNDRVELAMTLIGGRMMPAFSVTEGQEGL